MASDYWPRIKVDELIRRGVLAINDGYRVRNSELGPIGIPFVRGGDIGDGDISTAVKDYIRPEFATRVQSKLTRPLDVAFITKGTVGRVGLMRPGQPSSVFAPQVSYWRSLNVKQLEPRFLFFLLRSAEFQSNLDAVKTHGSMVADYVSMTDQRNFRLPIPPIREQNAIAQILGSLDDKIELNRRMNQTLEAIARALFKSWFVDYDPVRAKADGRKPTGMDDATANLFPDTFDESELGEIPNGWTVGKISDLATLNREQVNPGDFPTEEFDHFSLPAFDNGRTPKLEYGSQIMSNKFTVTPKSVLLSKLNPHIPRVWLPDLHPSRRSVCSTEFIVASSRPGLSREYLYSLFTSSAFSNIYGTLVTGTTGSHQRIRPESVLEINLVIPSESLIRCFTDFAKPTFEIINRNTEQSLTLAALRDTFLPKLLSGEIRIKDAERLVENVA